MAALGGIINRMAGLPGPGATTLPGTVSISATRPNAGHLTRKCPDLDLFSDQV
jgi:hypothetical protein